MLQILFNFSPFIQLYQSICTGLKKWIRLAIFVLTHPPAYMYIELHSISSYIDFLTFNDCTHSSVWVYHNLGRYSAFIFKLFSGICFSFMLVKTLFQGTSCSFMCLCSIYVKYISPQTNFCESHHNRYDVRINGTFLFFSVLSTILSVP